ncbi:MAG: ATP synthase F0 subunit B [Christensenellaceae bacterium]|jgi:F-type H+-transporting ATPase subunit b|nr:ATP synthase F0 subunit B [Christensenellaceae bacterium]
MLNAAPLGLNFWEILLHFVNLAILIVAVRFLLYKPLKKFMDKRRQNYVDAENQSKALTAEANALKAETEQAAAQNKREAVTIIENAKNTAEAEAREITAKAKASYDEIIQKAKEDAESANKAEMAKCAKAVADVAISIAEKLTLRELKSEDNDVLIDQIITGWIGDSTPE